VLLALGVVAGAVAPPAAAQTYPAKPAYSDEAGRGFQSEAGRCSDVKPATIPI
jgi:hypothetical protein